MENYLTYEELMALALKHYSEGGDSTYECVCRADFEASEYLSTLTEACAIDMFKMDKSIYDDCGGSRWL